VSVAFPLETRVFSKVTPRWFRRARIDPEVFGIGLRQVR